MSLQIRHPGTEQGQVLLGVGPVQGAAGDDSGATAVGLERPNGGDQNHAIRLEAGDTALDVEELLHAHVGPESRLGHHVVPEVESHPVGQDRGVAMGDVGERPGVDERRLTFEGLHQGRVQRVPHQDSDRPGHPDILERYRLPALGGPDDDPTATIAQVLECRGEAVPVGQGEDGHELAGHGDVVSGLPGATVGRAAQAYDHVAERAVVDVDDPSPTQLVGVDVEAGQPDLCELVVGEASLVIPPGVDRRRYQVVRHGDGVDVTGEMEVELVHRHHLAVPATGGATLDAECRSHARLPNARNRLVPECPEALNQPDRGGGLALTERGRRYRCDVDVLALGVGTHPFEDVEMDLGLRLPVWDQLVVFDPQLDGDLVDRLEFRRVGDLQVAGEVSCSHRAV